MLMQKAVQQALIEEERFLILAAEYGFNEEERKVIRDYMRHLAMTTIDSYSVVLDRKGGYLLNGLSIRNGTHLLDEVGLIIRNGEDPFRKMQEIVSEFNGRKENARNK
ncbi:MAG: hypothetical protein AB7F25_12385 [Deferribacterales bacterium]